MKEKRYCWLYILIISLWGCNAVPDVQPLYPVKSYENILLPSVWSIQEYNDNFYLNNYKNDQILIYDSSLTLLHTFGKSGRGPGEFQGAGSLFISNDSVYVYDSGGMRINVYNTSGEYERVITLPPVQLDWSKFVVANDRIYVPSALRSDSDILMLDLKGELIREIERDQGEFEYHYYRLLLSYKDQIIALNRSAPIVERFSENGVLLEEFDLRKINELERLWNLFESSSGNRKVQKGPVYTKTILGDAYIEDSFLYILCAGWPGRDKYTYMIRLSINGEKMKVIHIFKIQGEEPPMSLFSSFAVKNNRLLGFEDLSGKIFEFDLSQVE